MVTRRRQRASPDSTSSTLSCITVASRQDSPSQSSSMGASASHSTPPTSQGDENSVLSDAIKTDSPTKLQEEIAQLKPEVESEADQQTEPQTELQIDQDKIQEAKEQPEQQIVEQSCATTEPKPAQEEDAESSRRPARSSRKSVTTYNVQILAGTAIHTPTKYLEKHHKNVLHVDPSMIGKGQTQEGAGTEDAADDQLLVESGQKSSLRRTSSRVDLLKSATRNNVAAAKSTLGKKGREILDSSKDRVQALKRSASGSSRRYSDSALQAGTGAKGGPKLFSSLLSNMGEQPEERKDIPKSAFKKWEEQGLYVGQHRDFDARFTESKNKARRRSAPVKQNRERQYLPLPMFAGERLLKPPNVRDFKLPFDVYSPLPHKVKPQNWKKLSRNQFVGGASALWKKHKQMPDSLCICTAKTGCGEGCYNRAMCYECDSTNCPLTPEECGNRAFAELRTRAKGNRYDYGVEVVQTEDRGFGVRAMRTFEPYQIIVEYAGEIITQDEAEKRSKQQYKNNECFYLMSFDNKMIIDATRGSIARFVNHSCEPNCTMEKWTVAGEPRMALFAGDRGIMTGVELTYDYKFDPYSRKDIRECRCGAPSCRGVISSNSKDKVTKPIAMVKSAAQGLKRKAQEVLSGKQSPAGQASPNKRRKVAAIVGSALTKMQKTITDPAVEKRNVAEKLAAEVAAKRDAREKRAVRRSASDATLSSSRRSKTQRVSPSGIKKTTLSRRYTLNVPRKVSSPAPSAIRKPSGKLSQISSALKRQSSALSSRTRKSLPAFSSLSNESVDDVIPSWMQTLSTFSSMRQSTLPFKPLDRDMSSASPVSATTASESEMEDANGDAQEFAPVSPHGNKRPTTADSVRKAMNRSVRNTRRVAAVTKAGVGLGRTRGLANGVSGSTIRMVTGTDE